MTNSDEPSALAERIASSVDEEIEKKTGSRRTFLNRSALVGGSLLALGGGTGFALAEEHDDNTAEEMVATFDDVEGTDIDVLNYALTLEHLENSFYRQGGEMFDETDFMEADSLESLNEDMRSFVYSYVQTVGDQEAVHVDVLTEAVELLGGEPVEEASYNFGVETVGDFLALGQVLENTGVAAYAGAGPYIESPDLQGAALAIHSVEARHAAILNWVNDVSPSPNAFDPAQSQQEVLEAVSQFIESENGGSDGSATTTGGNGSATTTGGNGTETTTGGNGTETSTTTGGNET